MKKTLLLTALFGLVSMNVGAYSDWQIDNKINSLGNSTATMFNVVDDRIQENNRESIKRDNHLQEQIDKLHNYDDSSIKGDINNVQNSIDSITSTTNNIGVTQRQLSNDVNNLRNDLDSLSHSTRHGIAGAVAIAGLEKPDYNPNHKTSIMIGTGTYKGTTAVAYGIAYQPNRDMVFSIKGTDDEFATSVGISL